ncbi:MAG TPA: Stk1 family PASTA domain-containing Ser/Thr kinase [Clostridiales bacterium]|nr:Stk1 family PASTA domain-containing Ser/Thr kinase [Clostridiales bacterium]
MDLIGKVFDNRYEIIEKVGVGGMAMVYKAKCRLLNRHVAVKVLKQEYSQDEQFVNRFRIEAQASAELAHTNIVSIYDVGKFEDYYYLVMEFIDGMTLNDFITEKGTLSAEETSVITLQILSALEKAHSKGIVHCDIKPHNIMLTRDGTVKVCDFGIARAASTTTTTISTKNMGSVHYLSPEQARGGYVSSKSDIYSLGVVMYQMVTGLLPFTGESPVAVALNHIQDNPVPPIERNDQVPPAMNDIIMKAMKKSDVDRYESAAKMIEDISTKMNVSVPGPVIQNKKDKTKLDENKIKKINVETNEYEEVAKIRKNKRKNRTAVWGAIFVSVILIGIMGVLAFNLIPTLIPEPAFYVVEDYKGLDYNYAKSILEGNPQVDIIVETSFVNSETVQEGVVISQSVDKDIVFKEGIPNKIKLTVSNGPKLIKISSYRNTQARIAEIELKSLGFDVVVEEQHSSVPAGYVIRTDPDGGISLKPNDRIILYKSLGPKFIKVEVPDLTGMTLTEVRKALEEKNLKMGDIRPAGQTSLVAKVINQSPQAKMVVDEYSEVSIQFEEIVVVVPPEEGKDDILYPYVFMPEGLDKLTEPVKVLFEVKPSDTGKVTPQFNKSVNKDEFPVHLEFVVPVDGNTEILILVDNMFYERFVLDYKELKTAMESEGETEETTVGDVEGETTDEKVE